ncbi:MAG: S26 family signal peptidase [Alteraurantiacibacter sp. bin_em_oilr2.035]|nr:S26 family signal peptidase [Alteraurantiacibacter sp. bin_em_oilr2.035]
MKRRTLIIAGTVCAAALLSAALPLSRVLIWNATASVPTGLYHIRGTAGLRIGERVAIDPPPWVREYLATRGYLPTGLPLLKEVAALSGDTVCRQGLAITINSHRAGMTRAADSRGRSLPVWQGCRTIAEGEIFVMNRRASGSFDGRYFGPIARDRVLGRASPVWTDEHGDGAHIWFAQPNNQPSNNAPSINNHGDDQ